MKCGAFLFLRLNCTQKEYIFSTRVQISYKIATLLSKNKCLPFAHLYIDPSPAFTPNEAEYHLPHLTTRAAAGRSRAPVEGVKVNKEKGRVLCEKRLCSICSRQSLEGTLWEKVNTYTPHLQAWSLWVLMISY